MMTTTYFPAMKPNWFLRGEAWLDQRGKSAWITLMVVGFIAFWPVGLAILGYMLMTQRFSSPRGQSRGQIVPGASTGNAAFDAYRAETLRRLEEEQEAFQAFLDRLREARDKAEFDQFMEERSRRKVERPDSDESDRTAA